MSQNEKQGRCKMTVTGQAHKAPRSDSGRVSPRNMEMIDFLCVYVERNFIVVLVITLVGG